MGVEYVHLGSGNIKLKCKSNINHIFVGFMSSLAERGNC